MHALLALSDEIKTALVEKKAIVALESTIISHGMPYPANVETALQVEEEVRKAGAIPATISLKNGQAKVGMTADEIAEFGQSKDVWKVSIRDLPFVLSQKLKGATTVAATMRIAHWAGIQVFATGGIGGVHREGEKTMDISADLTEMAKTNVAVVSAGIKSILDIGLTLEYLETLGVPVVTIGTKDFPSFYSSQSGFESPLSVASVKELADMMDTKWSLGLEGSVLVAQALPANLEIPRQEMELHIQSALKKGKELGISGKHVTPFLLAEIARVSHGESLEANIALIKNNARLAAELSVAYQATKT